MSVKYMDRDADLIQLVTTKQGHIQMTQGGKKSKNVGSGSKRVMRGGTPRAYLREGIAAHLTDLANFAVTSMADRQTKNVTLGIPGKK
jgi:hypothetical protein